MKKLTDNQIRQRIQEWRNIKVLYIAAKKTIKLMKKERGLLMEQNELQAQALREQAEMIELLQLQVEELQRIVFGRKKKKKDKNPDDDEKPKGKKGSGKKRDRGSYKRSIPGEDEVTADEYHELDTNCPDCGTSLQDKENTEFYEEDIPLPDNETRLKRVTAHHVEKGWCPCCRKWYSAIPLPSAKVILGQNVRLYIIYLNILLRLSFSQIRALLWDTYHFRISEGEIAKILHQQADKLRPVFERLKKKLQASKGVHMDETGWCHGLYLWVMAHVEDEDALYLAGRSRGKGNADDLLGDDFTGVLITDAYAAYKNQPGEHQQCWAHPHRKLRELAQSKELSEEKRSYCKQSFDVFSRIYEDLRKYISEPFEKERRQEQKQQLLRRMRAWRSPDARAPKKLKNIKLQFEEYESEWLTCMDYEKIPCDNNKAERKLRHFVIKRKISFGNKSKKGHETFETLASVLMTTWKNYQDSFFPRLRELCV